MKTSFTVISSTNKSRFSEKKPAVYSLSYLATFFSFLLELRSSSASLLSSSRLKIGNSQNVRALLLSNTDDPVWIDTERVPDESGSAPKHIRRHLMTTHRSLPSSPPETSTSF